MRVHATWLERRAVRNGRQHVTKKVILGSYWICTAGNVLTLSNVHAILIVVQVRWVTYVILVYNAIKLDKDGKVVDKHHPLLGTLDCRLHRLSLYKLPLFNKRQIHGPWAFRDWRAVKKLDWCSVWHARYLFYSAYRRAENQQLCRAHPDTCSAAQPMYD